MQVAAARSADGVSGIVLWTIAGFVLYVLGGMVTLFVSLSLADGFLGALGIESHAGTFGLSIRNASHPIVWGAVVAAASMPIGTRLVSGLRFGATGWVVIVVGLTLAGVTTFLGAEFVRARHGVFDPEYQGFSFFAAPALVAISLATWASLAAPGRRGLLLVAATLTAVAGLSIALLPSVGGAADGIDPANVPLAATFTADALFGVAAALLVIRAASQPGTA